MPRKRRIFSVNGIYHVIMRGVNQQMIFEEEYDYIRFLQLLHEVMAKHKVALYAYCLMENHVHLLIRVKEPQNISKFMQSLNIRFIYWYNAKYDRHGSLYQGRFCSFPVDNLKYFMVVIRYIHNNPVKAAMVAHPNDYRWSSSRAYFNSELAKEQKVNVNVVSQLIGGIETVQNYLMTPADDECEDIPEYVVRFSGEQVRAMLLTLSECGNLDEFRKLDKEVRDYCLQEAYGRGVSARTLARVTGFARRTIARALGSPW